MQGCACKLKLNDEYLQIHKEQSDFNKRKKSLFLTERITDGEGSKTKRIDLNALK